MHQVDQSVEAMQEQEDARMVKLNAFAESLITKRKTAVDGRTTSGIEREWQEDEEFYDGIDDSNRPAGYEKGRGLDGGLTAAPASSGTKSNVFVNITQPYVDMASARVADMLLPTDDIPFSLDPTPMPNIIAATASMDMIKGPNGRSAPAGDIAQKMLDEAKERAGKSEKRIWDWLCEAHWHAEMRMVIEDAAKVGTAVLKGPFPIRVKNKVMQKQEDGSTALTIEEKMQPSSRRIDYKNFYPDPTCGESIHKGSFTWEKDSITARQLRDLKGGDYIDSQIDAVLKEGPNTKYQDERSDGADGDNFHIWYFHGSADHEDMAAAGCECKEGDVVPVMVTMVNDRVIKAVKSTVESGEFPYDVMVWQRKPGTWTGRGVGRQIRTPQRMLIAATRNLMDNAGLSSGPILIMREGLLSTADGKPFELRPRLVLTVPEDTDVGKVADAIHSVTIPSMQVELMNIIQFALEMAEKVTNMPLLMQGQQGAASDTVGGMTMLQNNAGTVLRRVAKIFDDRITVPHVGRYYEFLMLYGEDPDEKGDCVIVAHGSTALFERDAQHQAILQMGAMVMNPAFGINPEKWILEAFKAQKLDPKRFQYTDDEKKKMAEAAAKNGKPQDPAIEVATIRAEADLKRAEIAASATVEKSKMDTDRDTAYVQAETERTAQESASRREELQMKLYLAQLDYANKNNLQLQDVKAHLAEVAMKLNVQKELSTASIAADVHKHHSTQVATPAVEPAGRAAPGQAFQQ